MWHVLMNPDRSNRYVVCSTFRKNQPHMKLGQVLVAHIRQYILRILLY